MNILFFFNCPKIYSISRAFLRKKPFHKHRFRITATTAELGATIVSTSNHFQGNAMSILFLLSGGEIERHLNDHLIPSGQNQFVFQGQSHFRIAK